MSIPTTLLGTVYQIPETREKPWCQTVSALLVALANAVDALVAGGAGTPLLQLLSSTGVLAAGATLTPIRNWHRIAGNGGAVTLGNPSIANGVADGQILVITGTHATNTVTIDDASNVRLNGSITIGLYDALFLIWDLAVGDWIEIGRNQ